MLVAEEAADDDDAEEEEEADEDEEEYEEEKPAKKAKGTSGQSAGGKKGGQAAKGNANLCPWFPCQAPNTFAPAVNDARMCTWESHLGTLMLSPSTTSTHTSRFAGRA